VPALSIWSREDGILGAVAPLGLAAAAGTALVVDLDRNGPAYPGSTSLADLVSRGPTRTELRPTRRGVCIVPNGGIALADAADVLDALVAGWPRVVLRLPPASLPPSSAVQVHVLVPGALFPIPLGHRLVVQAAGWRLQKPPGCVVLPPPRRNTVGALLTGTLPPPGDRWVRAWRPVWGAA